jgi:hypothetical protein
MGTLIFATHFPTDHLTSTESFDLMVATTEPVGSSLVIWTDTSSWLVTEGVMTLAILDAKQTQKWRGQNLTQIRVALCR